MVAEGAGEGERLCMPALATRSLWLPTDCLCHSRLGALAKSLLVCEMNGLTPFTTDVGVASVVQALDSNTDEAINDLLDEPSERDIIKRLEWLQRVVLREFIDPKIFDELSVKDVLRLRTKAWGKAGEARTALNKQLKALVLRQGSYVR